MGVIVDDASIDRVLRDGVDTGAVPHVAAIVADRDGVIYEGGMGPRIAGESDEPVTTSTVFHIMSMTKIIATTAALQQAERGELNLDAPVEDYLPEFAAVQVLEGFDGDTPRLRAPASRATVKQLVTHTAGFGYWFWNADLNRYEKVTGIPNVVPGNADAFKAPMVVEPGTQFNYGINTDWLGKVVEAVAGKSLDVVIKENVTGPLGMNDTMFLLDTGRKDNAATVHTKNEAGQWTSAGFVCNFDSPDWWPAGHGMSSTPQDYIRFERMLLRGGELDGQRLLQQQTVEAAFSNQIGELDVPAEIPSADPSVSGPLRLGPGFKWGYGLLLNTTDISGGRCAWTGAWAGLFNTHFWIDRTTGICASIYTNSLPFITDEAWKLYGDFESAVYASL